MKRQLLILLLFAAIVTGCAPAKPAIPISQPEALPAWYLTPPAADAQWLYGAGLGKDRDEAVQNALDNLLGQLSISVESSLEINTQVSTHGYRQESRRQIRSEVAKIRIGNYQIAEAKELGYRRFAVLVQSDRKGFARSLLSDVQTRFASIDAALKSQEGASALIRYGAYKAARQEAEAAFAPLMVLKSVDSGFDATPYLEKSRALHAEAEQLRQSLSFQIHAEGYGQKMAEPIKAALAKERFTLTQKSDSALRLWVRAEVVRSRVSGIEIADIVLLIETQDAQGRAVGNSRHAFKSGAARGLDNAVESAAGQLQRQIAQEGIAAVLGLDL